jgi:uncharacterized MAPEG superfamily protein
VQQELLASLPVRLYAICALLLALKMLTVAVATGSLRMRRRVFASPEDYRFQGLDASVQRDPAIERARRAHRNDLENVLPFLAVAPIYALSGASDAGAWLCFVGFTTARILHTIFYLTGAMPHRTVAYAVGFFLTLWMIVSSAWSLLR